MTEEKKKVYKLKAEFMKPGDTYLGGHRPDQPDRVKLTMEDPYVKGEEYKIYEGDILREVTSLPSVEENIDSFKELSKKLSNSDEEEQNEEDVNIDEVINRYEESEEPEIEEAEELEVQSEEDVGSLPLPDELPELNRSELESVAVKLGVLEEIEGTGSGGYITVSDFEDYLRPELEEFDEN